MVRLFQIIFNTLSKTPISLLIVLSYLLHVCLKQNRWAVFLAEKDVGHPSDSITHNRSVRSALPVYIPSSVPSPLSDLEASFFHRSV